jgi:hypothetical protein
MSPDTHERARGLVIASQAEMISAADRSWLQAHLTACAVCTRYAEQIAGVIGTLRSVSVMPSPGLVSTTQLRVRARAQELRDRQARLRPLWIACAFAVLTSAVTTPYLWWGFEWVGHSLGVSDLFWQTGFVMSWTLPAIITAALVIARHTHFAPQNGA